MIEFPQIGTPMVITAHGFYGMHTYREVTVTRVQKRFFETSDGSKWADGWRFDHQSLPSFRTYPRAAYGNTTLRHHTPELEAEWRDVCLRNEVGTLLDRLDSKRRKLTLEQCKALADVLPGILGPESEK